MILLRAALAIAALILVFFIVKAFGEAAFWASFSAISADPWGLVTLVDLYLGFLVAAVVIALVERPTAAALTILGLLVLGNIIAALWLAVRLPKIAAALRGTR